MSINQKSGVRKSVKIGAGALLLSAGLVLGAAAPAALAYDGDSGGYTSCGAGTVVTWSSTTLSTYHKVNTITIGHWVNGASYTFRAASSGASAVADWEIYSFNGSMSYGYPKCQS